MKIETPTEARRKNVMKKFISVLAAVMFALMAIIPMTVASAESANHTMYVSTPNGGTVNVRANNNTDSRVLAVIGNGRPVTVTAENGDWSAVRVRINGRTVSGYIMNKYLSKSDRANARQTFKNVENPFTVKVYPASANGKVSIWNTTNKKNENKVRDIEKTEQLTVLAYSNAWYLVEAADGTIGYVAKAYVTKR